MRRDLCQAAWTTIANALPKRGASGLQRQVLPNHTAVSTQQLNLGNP
jgi:hypothetical protein